MFNPEEIDQNQYTNTQVPKNYYLSPKKQKGPTGIPRCIFIKGFIIIMIFIILCVLVMTSFVIDFLNSIPKYFIFKGVLQNYIDKQILELVQGSIYYDIHDFVEDEHSSFSEVVVWSPLNDRTGQSLKQERKILEITQSQQQMNNTIQEMMAISPTAKALPKFDEVYPKKELIPKIFFANSLLDNPNRKQYLEAEFHRFDKEYGIGNYDEELPFCVVLAGRNTEKVVVRLYDSIKNQNYSNYIVVHVVDRSTDRTIEVAKTYLPKWAGE